MSKRKEALKYLALSLLILSISFNFKEYCYTNFYIFSYTLDLKPTFITTMVSILTFGGFIIRNLDAIFDDNMKIIFCVLDIFFYAGLLTVFNSKETFLGISCQSFLYLMVVITWIGMKSIVRYIYLIYMALSVFRISAVNQAMGVEGSIYILSAFFSFMIQLYLNILPRVKNQNLYKDFFDEKKRKFLFW